MSSFNVSTTEVTSTDFLPTSLFTTLLQQTNEGQPDGKEPGPKGGGEPSAHSENIGRKQTLAVLAIILISLFVILLLLQIAVQKNCVTKFRKTQFRNISGKILFGLFLISLVAFFMNVIAFIHFIFNIDQLTETQYAHSLIFSMIPYRIGKLAMSLFFILRLHFVFKGSAALKLNGCIIITLIVLSVAGALLGCVAGTLGPLKAIPWSPDQKGVHPLFAVAVAALAITIFVDVIVMIYYVQRLMAVVVMQGEVTYVPSISPRSTQSKDDECEDEEVLTATVEINPNLVRTITKSTLLSLIGILTSFWLHLEMMIQSITEDSDGVLFRAIASIDGVVNVICMYLIFAFAKPYYNFGCKLCHIAMSKCCLFVTKKAIIKAKQTNQTNCGMEV